MPLMAQLLLVVLMKSWIVLAPLLTSPNGMKPMKMTDPGQSIGIALENSSVGTNTILVFINLSYWDSNLLTDLNLNLESVAGTIVPQPGSAAESFATAFFANLFNKTTAWLADAG